MKKIWKKINNFDNYEVSNFGEIRNKNGLVMKTWGDSHGYEDIKLTNGTLKKTL